MIGQNIKTVRLLLCMTQYEFAEAVGASQAAVSKWEKNRGNPNASHLKRMIELGGSSGFIFFGTGNAIETERISA